MDQNKRERSKSEGDYSNSRGNRGPSPAETQVDKAETGICLSPVLEGFVASMELQPCRPASTDSSQERSPSRTGLAVGIVLTEKGRVTPSKQSVDWRPENASLGFKVTKGFNPMPRSGQDSLGTQ